MFDCEVKKIGEGKKVTGKQHKMVCTVCNSDLGTIFESEEINKKFSLPIKFQCICSCGGDTFVVKSDKSCYFVQNDFPIKEQIVEPEKDFIKYRIFMGSK